MVKYCCVNNCKQMWRPDLDISFFSFPYNNENLLNEWLRIISKTQVSKNSWICSKHFQESDYELTGNKRKLKRNAVPSLFLSNSTENATKLTTKNISYSECKAISLRDISNFSDIQENISRHETTLYSENLTVEALLPKTRDQEILVIPETKDKETHISPRRLKPSKRENELINENKYLKNKLRRLEVKLLNVKEVMNHLKKEGKSSDELEDILLKHFSGLNLEILKNELENCDKKRNKRYSDKIKEFVSTLYFYSPKAYNYLRSYLNLPHEATLRKWVAEFSCKAGFLDAVFEFLQNESKNLTYLKDVALIFDSMSIKSNIAVNKNDEDSTFKGYIDYGSAGKELNLIYDQTDLATEVLVFQIVSYSNKFKIPIAHFFVNKISRDIQAKLINEAIKKLYNIDVVVHSITCDGTAVNFATLEDLGFCFQPEKMKTYIEHPCKKYNIYAIFDACHMIKLARNVFAEKQLYSENGNISFQYVKNLYYLQEEIGLKFANRLSSTHIYFKNKKMKVCLATQTISSRVADAIDYLRADKQYQFLNSEATTEFIRVFDKLFDLLNSRSAYSTGFKSPLSLSNFHYWNNVLNESEIYIRSLMCEGTPILNHRRKVFALGFLINIKSIRELALELLCNIENPLKYFLTYKISQDHIELYFCCLRRSRCGFNNNPDVYQVLWAIRRLLYKNSVRPSLNANCLSDDFQSSPILEFRSRKRAICENSENISKNDSSDDELFDFLNNINLSYYQENILYYITGNIISQFVKKCNCSNCLDIILSQAHDHNYIVNSSNRASFLTFVNRGKLCFPSDIAYEIVKFGEKAFKAQLNIGFMGSINFKERMIAEAVKHYTVKIHRVFQPSHPIVDTSNPCNELHEIKIIKFIIGYYAKIRLNAFAKTKTLEYLGRKATMRQKLHKTILFYHI